MESVDGGRRGDQRGTALLHRLESYLDPIAGCMEGALSGFNPDRRIQSQHPSQDRWTTTAGGHRSTARGRCNHMDAVRACIVPALQGAPAHAAGTHARPQ